MTISPKMQHLLLELELLRRENAELRARLAEVLTVTSESRPKMPVSRLAPDDDVAELPDPNDAPLTEAAPRRWVAWTLQGAIVIAGIALGIFVVSLVAKEFGPDAAAVKVPAKSAPVKAAPTRP